MVQRVTRLTGLKKAAILLLALGPNLSSKVLKHFSEADIEKITAEIANTTRVDKESLDEVLNEFIAIHQAQQYILKGGFESAKEILERTMGPQKASEVLRRLKESSKVKPFTFVRNADAKQLVNLISQEHPQTIAFILSYLDAEQAAMVISGCPRIPERYRPANRPDGAHFAPDFKRRGKRNGNSSPPSFNRILPWPGSHRGGDIEPGRPGHGKGDFRRAGKKTPPWPNRSGSRCLSSRISSAWTTLRSSGSCARWTTMTSPWL